MKISADYGYDNEFIASDDQVTNTFNKFKNNPSIIMMKNKKKKDGSFSFAPTTYDGVLKKVKTLDIAKAFLQSEIPTKILKLNSDYFAEYFYENINQCISKSIFPSDLKLADVTPVYKKKSKNCKGNQKLANYPIFPKFMKDVSMIKFSSFFYSVFFKYQCRFRIGYNAQQCLITLIEKWEKSVDNGGAFGTLFTDLSKTFYCLPHELLIARIVHMVLTTVF